MKLEPILEHPLTHRIARHTHDYGLYVSLALFQKEFIFLLFSGAFIIVTISFLQWKAGLDDGKE